MKRIADFFWPDNDTHCHPVILDQVADVDKVLELVDGRDVVVQAGGNVGVWARRLAPDFKRVYTFEPDKENFECLDKNITEENVQKYNYALGDKGVRVKMVGDKSNCGAYQVEEGGDIPVIRIDDLDLNACDLIYLDIEGYELMALNGGMKTIEKFHPVIAYEDKKLSEKYGYKKGGIEGIFKEYGYEVALRIHRDVVLCWSS